ncbi:hypothetical protein [Rathayibacter rathayi]|uniref:hypothetical protein n=1 Tax=Rathayibacter rathayi TaxID=33887 RepID=UPI000CE8198C|nr:hypothetical protein [Rathayibacter rathayi]PPG96514.1 hypothetical protein C5C22_02520 [Rathayibacter rathayi]
MPKTAQRRVFRDGTTVASDAWIYQPPAVEGLHRFVRAGVTAELEPVTHVISRRLRSLHPNTQTADLEGADAAELCTIQ